MVHENSLPPERDDMDDVMTDDVMLEQMNWDTLLAAAKRQREEIRHLERLNERTIQAANEYSRDVEEYSKTMSARAAARKKMQESFRRFQDVRREVKSGQMILPGME